MIVGHGIDLQDMTKVSEAYKRNSKFAQRVLTDKELDKFQSLTGNRQISYLAGRWAAKEAFSKAWGTGIGKLTFRDLEILNNAQGAPVFTHSPFMGKIWISISHSGNFVQASVILEEEK